MLEGFTILREDFTGGARCAACDIIIEEWYMTVPEGGYSVVHCLPCGEVLHEAAVVVG